MNLIRKRKSKPIRGSRKIRLRELPWMTYIKYFSLAIIVGYLGFQFFSMRFHAYNLAQSQKLNKELTSKVSTLNTTLSEEKQLAASSLAKQSDDLQQMKLQITKLSTDLSETKQDNSDLTTQINNYRNQNDVLRQKLETMLGNASRSGSELSPSPIGKSGMTLAELQKLTKGTNLAGIETALLKIETTYNCNALFALAVAKLETGGGTSKLCKENNNLFGMRKSSGWMKFSTKSESVLYFGNLMKTKYFAKGYKTLAKIGPKYAEGSTTWDDKAKYHMLNDMRKIIR